MTAFTILKTAFRNIFADFGQTLRIFALPSLIATAAKAAFIWVLTRMPDVPPELAWVLAFATLAYCALWATINFHRHILLGERFGWWPKAHLRPMLGYGLMLIPMGLVLIAVGYAIVIAAYLGMSQLTSLGSGEPGGPGLIVILPVLLVATLISAIGLRMLSLLPGIAINETLRGYRRQSRGSLTTIILIGFVFGLFLGANTLSRLFLMEAMETFGAAIAFGLIEISNIVNSVFLPVYGISLLTALYAHYVQAPKAGG